MRARSPIQDQRNVIAQLNAERKRRKWSFQTLSNVSGVNVATVHGALMGDTQSPSWVTVAAIAAATGLRFALVDENGQTVTR